MVVLHILSLVEDALFGSDVKGRVGINHGMVVHTVLLAVGLV